MTSRKFSALILSLCWLPAVAVCVSYAGGCVEHHHHDDREAYVDEHGWHHEGFYDADRHWHGGYHDEHGEYHEDPADWHH